MQLKAANKQLVCQLTTALGGEILKLLLKQSEMGGGLSTH